MSEPKDENKNPNLIIIKYKGKEFTADPSLLKSKAKNFTIEVKATQIGQEIEPETVDCALKWVCGTKIEKPDWPALYILATEWEIQTLIDESIRQMLNDPSPAGVIAVTAIGIYPGVRDIMIRSLIRKGLSFDDIKNDKSGKSIKPDTFAIIMDGIATAYAAQDRNNDVDVMIAGLMSRWTF